MTTPPPDNPTPDASDSPSILLPPPPRMSLFARLRNYFLAGIIVTAPIGLTIYLVVITIEAIDRNVQRLIPQGYEPERFIPVHLPYGIPGLGIVAALLLLTLIGFLATNFLGRTLLRLGERIVARMPVVRGIYSALKQVFETVFSQSGNSFRQVALVPWPSPGSWTIAFVTNYVQGEIARRLDDELVTVYVPTTPNPTGGYMAYFRRSDVVILSMSVDEAMKLIISCGVIVPPEKMPPVKSGAGGKAGADRKPASVENGGFTP
ncbi:DUF502 domain-containing protein [Ferrovibrio sp.]|uniref:DUF502 domain-containing protein n=1 Tax=Ferrovibrio sp. TaxID=1917215 RepID=UPI00311D595B